MEKRKHCQSKKRTKKIQVVVDWSSVKNENFIKKNTVRARPRFHLKLHTKKCHWDGKNSYANHLYMRNAPENNFAAKIMRRVWEFISIILNERLHSQYITHPNQIFYDFFFTYLLKIDTNYKICAKQKIMMMKISRLMHPRPVLLIVNCIKITKQIDGHLRLCWRLTLILMKYKC